VKVITFRIVISQIINPIQKMKKIKIKIKMDFGIEALTVSNLIRRLVI
jgi:hypothetical protein